jgi:hypothetical protein
MAAVIIGMAELAAARVAADPKLSAMVKQIDEAAERGAQLVPRMLAFARKQPLEQRILDLNDAVKRAVGWNALQVPMWLDNAVARCSPSRSVDPSRHNKEDHMAAVARIAHREEWLSILIALGTTVGSVASFWLAPTYQPASGLAWTLAGWFAFGYLFFQTLFLLVSATQGKALGVSDPIVASFPFVAGLVVVAAWLLGRLPLSHFQLNGLAFLLATTLAEFFLTVWIRIVVNRRAAVVDSR